jgi:translation initiation factor IF-2
MSGKLAKTRGPSPLRVVSATNAGFREASMAEELIGTVTHYFGKPKVAAIDVTAGVLRVGDTIRVVGHTSDFTQTVDSMQIEHEAVEEAGAGASVGIKVTGRARVHDLVYRVEDD